MQLGLWILLTLVTAVLFRRKPLILAVAAITIWVAVPGVAGGLVTGRTSGSLSVHPATWLIIWTLLVRVLQTPHSIAAALARNVLVFILLTVFVGVAVVTTKGGVGGSGLVLVMDQIAGPIALYLVLQAMLMDEPSLWRPLRNTIVVLALIESAVAVVQWVAGNVLFYEKYYLHTYWFDPERTTRWMGTMDNPLVLSLLLCSAMPFVAGFRRVLVQLPILALMMVGVLVTQSRTGLFVTSLVVVYVVLRSPARSGPKTLAILILVAGAAVLASSALVAGVSDRLAVSDGGSTDARGAALNLFLDHLGHYWILGGGSGASYRFASLGGLRSSLESSILMYAVDFGVIFSLLYFGIQLRLALLSVPDRACRGLFVSALLVVILPQTFSALGLEAATGVVIWWILAIASASRPAVDSTVSHAENLGIDGATAVFRGHQLST